MQTKLTTGERLTDLRREHNLTLEQVSEQTGIVKSTLSNYENDKSRISTWGCWRNWRRSTA